ncbi:MAG TPA: SDR family NAD(P)-dependent oxidoreductase, partial [Actinomycetota bacterium]|nr:SDR family NAD(P)-dependent oxidoreductase [Actinomycetota bacterium]
MDGFRLDGKTAVITGAAMGIGFGISEAFVSAGANTFLVDRDGEALRAAAGKLEGRGTKVSIFEIDLTD